MPVSEHTKQVITPVLISEDNYNIPQILNQKHFPGLDGLRAVAIIFVVLAHCFINSPFQLYTDIGKIGVEIFFVISGFLITTLLLKERVITGKASLRNFYIRRALRIVPVAWFFLAIVFFLNIFFHLQITSLVFFACLFYFLNFPVKGELTWQTAHFWSLSVEEQFYLFFPVLVLWNKTLSKWVITILFFVVPVIAYFFFSNTGIFYTNNLVHYSTTVFLVLFEKGTVSIFMGCLFSILLFEGTIKNISGNKYLSLAIFLIALALRFSGSPFFIKYFSQEIFSVLMAFVILLNLNAHNYFSKFLNNKIIQKIGVMSYSIYIWQQLFTYNQPWAHLFKYADSLLLNIPLLFLVSYISYFFYEKRFLNLKKRFGFQK